MLGMIHNRPCLAQRFSGQVLAQKNDYDKKILISLTTNDRFLVPPARPFRSSVPLIRADGGCRLALFVTVHDVPASNILFCAKNPADLEQVNGILPLYMQIFRR